jgi:branched-chain amino acid transport system substrate-binding protein
MSATGPAASLGIPEKNTISLMPKTIGGQKINYIVLDDASDTTAAVANTRKLIAENKVDIVLGSTTTPNSLAMIDVVSEAQTPMISIAASARIIEPMDAKKKWVFKTPQNDIMMSLAIAEHMAGNGREDGRLHRLLRRLRRRLVAGIRQGRRAQEDHRGGQRALQRAPTPR